MLQEKIHKTKKEELTMGTLRYAILGLLNRRSMSGYEMAKEFETTLFEFWTAKHSQIYPELKSLTKEGLVQYEIEVSGTVLEKKVYSITEKGRDLFLKWEQTLFPMPASPKDEFRLQLFFSDCIGAERQLQMLTDQLSQHENRLHHLKENSKKFQTLPPEGKEALTDYMVLRGAIIREEATCKWLRESMELCQSPASSDKS